MNCFESLRHAIIRSNETDAHLTVKWWSCTSFSPPRSALTLYTSDIGITFFLCRIFTITNRFWWRLWQIKEKLLITLGSEISGKNIFANLVYVSIFLFSLTFEITLPSLYLSTNFYCHKIKKKKAFSHLKRILLFEIMFSSAGKTFLRFIDKLNLKEKTQIKWKTRSCSYSEHGIYFQIKINSTRQKKLKKKSRDLKINRVSYRYLL